MTGAPGRVVVVIPTFRRPVLLSRLLESLASETMHGAEILVGDNDCSAEIKALVARWRETGLPVHYAPVADRGLAAVRNALVAAAANLAPDWRWLAMLDDDGYVPQGWLSRMVACGEVHQADLVGGPVTGVLPVAANRLASNSVFAARRRWPTGPVPTLNTTQNLLVSRSLLDRVSAPLFDARYGLSGGEDYDLFRRASLAGAKLVWCDEAEVFEPTPEERLTRKAILHRYYSTGMYMGPIDRSYDGLTPTVAAACKGLVGGVAQFLAGVLRPDDDRRAKALLTTAHHVGRLRGLMGGRLARYLT